MKGSNRLAAIHILELLNEHASSTNRMRREEVLERLKNEYDIDITRRTLYDYLKELSEEGYVISENGLYRRDLFSERELRTLIDGVMYGKHIPKNEADNLISKLKSLSQNTMSNKAKYLNYFSGINRTDNGNLYEILDTIDEAITKKKKIIIYRYSPLPDGSKSEKLPEIVDPYFVVADQSRYYLLCNANRDEVLKLESRRVDRILKVEITKERVTPIDDVVGRTFDLGKYMREHIYMFSGDASRIEIKIKSENIKYLIDWFGTEYLKLDIDGEYATVALNTNENAAYYWALQYGEHAEIIEPKELRDKVKQGLEKILEKYK